MIIPKIDSTKSKKDKKTSFDALAVECPPTDNIKTATIAMVGEAPSDIELLKQEPFVGPAGSQFNRICAAVRLARYQVYLTNACKAKLPKNDEKKLWTEKGFRHPAWGELQSRLIDELAEFPGKVIMLLGATAMKLLIDEPKFDSIGKYRGSFYHAEDFPHLKEKLSGKIIGLSYHPSFTMAYQQPIHFYTIIADFTKALKIIEEPTLLEDNTDLKIRPSLDDILKFYALIKTKEYIGFDIEATPEFITCFSLAVYHEGKIISMSIPFLNNQGNYWSVEEEVKIWIGLAEILNDSNLKKICQNGMFDVMFTLRTMGIKTDNFYFDTMLAQHRCYTELPKGLDYLTSVYTYYPYYKDEGKQSHLKVIKDWPSYWLYNAKDSAYLLPIAEALIKELEEFESTEVMTYMMDLHKPLMEMEFNGILTDKKGVIEARKELEDEIVVMQTELNTLVEKQTKGKQKEINPNSSKQMIAYFYGICMLKPYVNRKTGNATCNSMALHRIAKKGGKGSEEAKLIIKIRKNGKLVSTYFTVPVDDDNRLRCSHKITGTVSGRIATEQTFFGTGTNLQNQPYLFKQHLVSDPDWIFCECDLAKAEAHVVAYLCQDANMIESFESGIDVHSFNASKIFNIPIEKVIEEAHTKKVDQRSTMRYMGKKVVHASNYSMGPQTFSDNLAVEDIFMSQGECKKLLNNYQDRFPGLKRWHRSIEEEVQRTRILYNLFGSPRKFLGDMGPALYRNAYSYKPQSTVAELLNRGLIKMANDPRLGKDAFDIRMLTTVHDSVLFQFHKSQIKNLLQILLIIKDHMTHTFTYKGRSFTIGLDAKIGKQWAGKTAEIGKFTQSDIDKAIEKLELV
jgi:uracil-DNA glycosylase family 4